METNKKLHSITLASTFLILFLILVSSTASAANEQSTSNKGTYAYITNDDGTVSVINTASNTISATVPVGNDPFGVAVSPDGTKVYVTDYKNSRLYVIDAATNTVTTKVPVGKEPHGVAVTPDGAKVYVVNEVDNTISVIDTFSNHVIAKVSVGKDPFGVSVNPTGTKTYVTNSGSDTVSIIDTSINKVTDTINGLSSPGGITTNPSGTELYVSSGSTNTVYVIDTATNAVTSKVLVGKEPKGVAVSPDGTKVYVANYGSNSVSVIDTTTNKVTVTVKVGHNPYGVGVTPDGTKVYVANRGTNNDPGNSVSVIKSDNNKVIATVRVGNHPKAFGKFIGAIQSASPTLNIPANPLWTDTGIKVVKGQTVSISASGTWNTGNGECGPDGDDSTGFYDLFLTSDAPSKHGELIAFIGPQSTDPYQGHLGNGSFFPQPTGAGYWAIGSNATFTADRTGELWLGINDDAVTKNIGDNTGSLATVTKVTTPVLPVASFTSNVTSGKAPLTVKFTDKSTGSPTSWKWSFGDKSTSTAQNPTHKYSKIGKYTVSLTVKNAKGSNTKTVTNYITVKK